MPRGDPHHFCVHSIARTAAPPLNAISNCPAHTHSPTRTHTHTHTHIHTSPTSPRQRMAPQDDAPIAADTSTRAMRGASLLILLQVASRGLTFIANQVLLRFLTAQLLGVATQLEVYYLSVIFFARESLRVAIQRATTDTDEDTDNARSVASQAVVNLGYLATALGVPLSLVLGGLYLGSVSSDTLASTPNLVLSLYIYAAAAVVELLSEPAFVVMQVRLQFGVRASAESAATLARCVVTLGVAVWGARRGVELGVLPFALGQLSYGGGLFVVYAYHGAKLARREGFSLLPAKPLPTGTVTGTDDGQKDFALAFFYRPTLRLASSMMAQSIVKHILTQGDTFLVSTLSTPAAQGVYALANNYGGLAARLLFQPIEESSRSYFSRLLAVESPQDIKTVSEGKDVKMPTREKGEKEASTETEPPSNEKGTSNETESPSKKKEPPPRKEGRERYARAARDLTSLFRTYAILSVIITTLGPSASPLLLSLIAGPRWSASGAGACLGVYMWYIPFLAFNGVAEAFVASVATQSQVHKQSAWMGVFSLGFAAAGFIFLRLLDMGAVGLVVANGINMACRITWCVVFIKGYFATHGVEFDLLEIMPKPMGLLAGAVASQMVKRVIVTVASPGAREAVIELVKVAAVALPFVFIL